jgi:hypothetical protein
MPVPTFVDKNIWVAAGDGDLSRVTVSNPLHSNFCVPHQPERLLQELIEHHCKFLNDNPQRR